MTPGVPVDEFGLMIIVRMYHEHITVITETYTWTSGWNLLAKECKFIFTYAGGLSIHMVCNQVAGFLPSSEKGTEFVKAEKKPHIMSSFRKQKINELSSEVGTKSRKRRRSSRLVQLPLPYQVVKVKGWQTKTAKKAAAASNKYNISLDNVLKKQREKKRFAALSNFKEDDPIAGHLR